MVLKCCACLLARHVLQPLDKTFCLQKVTNLKHLSPNAVVTKFGLGKLFSATLKKKVITVGNAVKDFECTATNHFNSPPSPKTNFCPLPVFCKIQPTLSAGTHKIPCKNHKPSGPPALQSTSDLNEAG